MVLISVLETDIHIYLSLRRIVGSGTSEIDGSEEYWEDCLVVGFRERMVSWDSVLASSLQENTG